MSRASEPAPRESSRVAKLFPGFWSCGVARNCKLLRMPRNERSAIMSRVTGLLFAILFFFGGGITPQAAGPEFKRLDPHGGPAMKWEALKAPELRNQTQCTVCHVATTAGLSLKPNPAGTCTNCHNASPHSGVAEHMGKTHRGETVTCLSCHRPHRAAPPNALAITPGGTFFSPGVTAPAPQGLHKGSFEKTGTTSSDAMLKRSCTECHAW